ncbi:hypothetical protein [Galactobacter valiniphilus]|nr:hypothetical protein [Galactobacter valiniphilus]
MIPYLFLVTMLVAVAWYVFLRARRPQVISAIGNTETDMLDGVG